MKRIAIIGLMLGLGLFGARAEDNPHTIDSQVLKENNFRNSLWFGSDNTAALAFRPFQIYNDLNISYDGQYGDFRPQQEPAQRDNISLNTSGSTWLGKFLVWGSFSFRNIFDKGIQYNAMSYEIEDDMPYFMADSQSSPWKKQEYDIQARIASPVLWNMVSFGLGVHYVTKVGAKQLDPACETYKYNIEITPSITLSLGKGHLLGVSGLYDNQFEISDPTLNNYRVSQRVYISRGVGEAFIHKVGDNDGLKDAMFSTQRYGGGIQYGYSSDVEVLADFGFIMKDVLMRNNPSQPRTYGSTSQSLITGDVSILFGKAFSNKLWLSGEYRTTKGTEFTQAFNSAADVLMWETVNTVEMSSYTWMYVEAGYDHQFGAEDARGYDWIVGARAAFFNKSDEYYLPYSTYGYTGATAEVSGGKQFKFKKSSLLIKLGAGYNMSLGGEYVYGGANPDYWIVDLYNKDIIYNTTDWLKAGGQLSYTIKAKKINFVLNAKVDWIKPFGADSDRLLCSASFGIIF